MKNLLLILTLLLLGVAQAASAQKLMLWQLVTLYSKEQLEQDAYLVKLGWKFHNSAMTGDSINELRWHFYNSKGARIGEVVVSRQIGRQPLIGYGTVLRPAFDEIRQDALAVPQMEARGTHNADSVMRTYYRDPRFDFLFEISSDPEALPYVVIIQRHGLVKAFVEHEDGTQETEWVKMPVFTKEQKRRLDALADSVERINQALRPKPRLAPKRPKH